MKLVALRLVFYISRNET